MGSYFQASLGRVIFILCVEKKGVFLYRINLSHTFIDVLEDLINEIRKYTETPICLDSEGAQIRNKKCEMMRFFSKKISCYYSP